MGNFLKHLLSLSSEVSPSPQSARQMFRHLVQLLVKSPAINNVKADREVFSAIQAFIDLMRSNDMALGGGAKHSSIWGRKSILFYLGSELNEPFLKLISKSLFVKSEFQLRWGAKPSLVSQLGLISQIASTADDLKQIAQILEDFFDPETDDYDEMKRISGGLSAIGDVLDLVNIALPPALPEWCKVCFRRAKEGSYCDAHRPNRVSTKDTAYRKAKRNAKNWPRIEVGHWNRYQKKRRLLGENFLMVSSDEDPLLSVGTTERVLLVSPEIYGLVTSTLSQEWDLVVAQWDLPLKTEFSAVQKLMGFLASDCVSWEVFASKLHAALGDNFEDTSHPLWVLYILVGAQGWLVNATGGDRRRTDTVDRIISLYCSGITNAKELAERVGKDKGYIHRVIRENDLKQPM